jgi:hypothetical protein
VVDATMRVGPRYQATLPACTPVAERRAWPAEPTLLSRPIVARRWSIATWTIAIWAIVTMPLVQ